MDLGLAFWAQSLDNDAPDHMQLDGRGLAPDETNTRQDVVARVSRVTREGERLVDTGSVILTWHASEFVLELTAAERDVAGRAAPMACHGPIPAEETNAWTEELLGRFHAFAATIDRTIPAEAARTGVAALSDLQKKKRQRMLKRRLLLVAGILVAVISALLFRSSGMG